MLKRNSEKLCGKCDNLESGIICSSNTAQSSYILSKYVEGNCKRKNIWAEKRYTIFKLRYIKKI